MSTESELLAGLKGVSVPAGIKTVLEAHADAAHKIDVEPLLPSAKAERKAALWEATAAKLAAEVARVETETLQGFDQAEGTARAEAKGLLLKGEHAERRAMLSAQLQASALLVRELDNPGAIVEQFEAALITEDPTTVRTVGALVVQKLRALEREKKTGQGREAVTQALAGIESRFSAWRRENPSPVEKLREIERQRGNAKATLTHAVELALRVYGISSKAGSLHAGAAFDRLSA